MTERIIFHIDVNNAFLSWSAVKLLKEGYKIDIRTIPSIIGGDEKARHGIVLAKSPVAKKYGIKTAETLFQAKQKCAQLQIYSPDYNWYYQKSSELFTYLSQYTPLIEQYSIDECFLDMTGTNYLYKNHIELANKIKNEINQKFGYTVNIGIGNNKLCAKMASDFEKPNKIHTLYKNEIQHKLWNLDVGELFMCGKKTAEELKKLNIYTIEDLARVNDKILERKFKNQAIYLKKAAWGIDDSEVVARSSKRDSISTTETLPYDYNDSQKLKEILLRQTEKISRELRKQNQYTKTVTVIFRNSDFQNYTSQTKLKIPTNKTDDIYKSVLEIFNDSWKKDSIRLIGVRLSDFTDNQEHQMTLFDNSTNKDIKEDKIQKIIDDINNKFGNNSVIPATLKKIVNVDKNQ